jgi:hypothetical protein
MLPCSVALSRVAVAAHAAMPSPKKGGGAWSPCECEAGPWFGFGGCVCGFYKTKPSDQRGAKKKN